MSAHRVVFVAYQDQPNLGIGCMASYLRQEGFDVAAIDVRLGPEYLLQQIRALEPLLVGFSLIFQYHTPDLAESVSYLRHNGVVCPICTGGHYPSLRPEDVLRQVPALDLVVRFEGEHTVLELARRLAAGQDWRDVRSIAYLAGGELVETPLRPLIHDLDRMPFPERHTYSNRCLGIQATSLLASRGCLRNCSFCSIRRFYSIPPGQVRRTRSAQNVVQEMRQLNAEHAVQLFLFQDDDFALMSERDRQWVHAFVDTLRRAGPADTCAWKINCRADEVEAEIFAEMQSAGLFLVYLGLESGNDTGLRILNKHITVEQNLRAVQILKDLGLGYEFGFMLFDPSSSVDLVLENVRFLREVCGDGSALPSFGKTLPYGGTDIEEQLREEGRLRGDVASPDYAFLDRQTDEWFAYLADVFYPWVRGRGSLQQWMRWAMLEVEIMRRFYPHTQGLAAHSERIQFLSHWYNEIFFRVVEDSARFLQAYPATRSRNWRSLRSAAEKQRSWLEAKLAHQRKTFFAEAGFPPEIVLDQECSVS